MCDSGKKDIKVLIVEHSPLSGLHIARTLQSDPDIKIVSKCSNSADVLEKIQLYKPDIITIEDKIEDKGGFECVKKIVGNNRVPIIVLDNENNGSHSNNVGALSVTAMNSINKSANNYDLMFKSTKKDLIKKIHMANSLKYNHNKNTSNDDDNALKYGIYSNSNRFRYYNESSRQSKIKNIIAIGVSAGGPKNLLSVIPLIPRNLPAAYLIVQHMPAGFTNSFAKRLDSLSDITVKEAQEGEAIEAGVAYLAPGGYHMLVEKDKLYGTLRIKLSTTPPKNSVRPSADILFNSLSEIGVDNLIGVIMTGMGCDGLEGLTNMKLKNNAHIIAESEESCMIFGMPKAVIKAGIADTIVSAREITNEIINFMGVDSNGYEPIH